ncbi:Acetolactate synthase large subunit [Slackia heliotrinireducens]|uniref:Acetolactate synthase n=1 Tax=Slackia heliotrinireducens (strain ATCC 29202 / DSM 20476 / NCTC 11029 / RHS 1) TaxID=471855 RepID=C7N1H5_SLAHD|nr:biosynthetic-type acetolactate synthase large subunit [Slackia heliotrinireducens]ACV21267.1 acetolactate synthase, large subunit [Slackia heliotrinireducens DSM 20476]VEG98702.1 Acetolactate synthase large subunit [Slackia heliotrinireducens]
MMNLQEDLERKSLAIAGKPFGPGSATEHEGQRMNGAQAVVASLEAEGVETIFGYPGGTVIDIYDALYDSKIKHVLARHEQGACHMADGYARSTGRPGVCLVTSGPGATNVVTAIATAFLDSIPLIVITGQVKRPVIGTDAFQEADTVGITMPIVKHSYLLTSTDDLTKTFREAFYIASTGRPGPVLIDVPSDISTAEMVFHYPDDVNLPSYKPTYKGNARQIKQTVSALKEAKRPLLYVGGGVALSFAEKELADLAHMLRIPVVTTLMAVGVMDPDDELNLGAVGMHGSRYANKAMNDCDLLIAVGARFSERVTGRIDTFNQGAKVIHIDIDPAEIGKVRAAEIPIVGDAQIVLATLAGQAEKQNVGPVGEAFAQQCFEWRERWPLYDRELAAKEGQGRIVPEASLLMLSGKLDRDNSIVVTDVGQHQMWAFQFIKRNNPGTFLTSGGLGTMGYGLPAAIGAQIVNPDQQVVLVTGDGSFQMCIQEMATATINNAPVKVVILDNRALGMVHQWQKLFYNGRYSATVLDPVPDFVKLAEAYGWQGERIVDPDELSAAYDRMLAAEGPYLLDVDIRADMNVYPMVPAGAPMSKQFGAIDMDAGGTRIRYDDVNPPIGSDDEMEA